MRPSDYEPCPGASCGAVQAAPCRQTVAVALVLGAIGDAQGMAGGVTWGALKDWVPGMSMDDISDVLVGLIDNGHVDVYPAPSSEDNWAMRVTGQGWITLAQLVESHPTMLGWAKIMPGTFRPVLSVDTKEAQA